MTILPLPVGALETNCYVVYKQAECAVVIDPGDEEARISAVMREKGIIPRAILLTHAHFDHMMAAEALSQEWSIPIWVHEAEREALGDSLINLSAWMGGSPCHLSADRFLRDGDKVTVGTITLHVLHTPGHTRGSCCYWLTEEGVIFSGDTLFFHSMGRTDFPGGSALQLRDSVHRLLQLKGDATVYPGHGPATTLAQERINNPYAGG